MNSAQIKPPSQIAELVLRMHDDGALSISGHVGDVRLALQMIDAAREAVARQLGRPTILEPHGAGLVVPHKDFQGTPNEKVYPLIAEGDRKQ